MILAAVYFSLLLLSGSNFLLSFLPLVFLLRVGVINECAKAIVVTLLPFRLLLSLGCICLGSRDVDVVSAILRATPSNVKASLIVMVVLMVTIFSDNILFVIVRREYTQSEFVLFRLSISVEKLAWAHLVEQKMEVEEGIVLVEPAVNALSVAGLHLKTPGIHLLLLHFFLLTLDSLLLALLVRAPLLGLRDLVFLWRKRKCLLRDFDNINSLLLPSLLSLLSTTTWLIQEHLSTLALPRLSSLVLGLLYILIGVFFVGGGLRRVRGLSGIAFFLFLFILL